MELVNQELVINNDKDTILVERIYDNDGEAVSLKYEFFIKDFYMEKLNTEQALQHIDYVFHGLVEEYLNE